MQINQISGIDSLSKNTLNKTASDNTSFGNILSDAINITNQNEQEDVAQTVGMLSGDVNDLHTAMLAMEKADISLQFTMQIRNKILDAYNEVMRMQV